MRPDFSKSMRALIVGRARYIDDLVEEQIKRGITQYVILGAGLDTFAQRKPELASRIEVFEIDQPGPQAWKQKRLDEIGFTIPEWLHFVSMAFYSKAFALEVGFLHESKQYGEMKTGDTKLGFVHHETAAAHAFNQNFSMQKKCFRSDENVSYKTKTPNVDA